MDAREYTPLALRTASKDGQFVNAGLGIAGEAGEVADIVKKVTFHNKPLDRGHAIAELGDLCWYINSMIDVLDTSWSEVFETNIRKLEARYPDGCFNTDRANNRDVKAELMAMLRK